MNPGDGPLRLPERAPHPGLEPVGPGARQHLVDADDVERMQPHADVELVLAAVLHQVFVAADAARLERLRRQLFIFVGNEMDAQREIVDRRLLLAEIEDADLRIRHTAAEPRLRIRLVFAVAVTGTEVENFNHKILTENLTYFIKLG